MSTAATELLQREISNPDTQWSLGTFGATAEFSRDPGERNCTGMIDLERKRHLFDQK
ncbi:hypothetical protein [Bradyrhizobium sp. CCBAU 051011]|jgi:hypothetical protein|uniref:DUF6925 family protein n=1 Tax=Bradyrhizobium sp. CCBAU 051011 TaxID=858422 RepID=UPI00137B8905|nr:hypothetical protein [Bradyrhizobium sp. CCBAU 051011]